MAGNANPYGYAHQRERERHRPTVERGEAWCTEIICLKADRWIEPGTPWHLAHNRTDGGYLGPAHEQCNTAEGGRWRHARRLLKVIEPRRWVL